jgi:tetratricopeptide (TPR) repeat protein
LRDLIGPKCPNNPQSGEFMTNMKTILIMIGLIAIILTGWSQSNRPLVLIFQQNAPAVKNEEGKEADPNLPLMRSAMAEQLRALGKLEVVVFSLEHPTAERITRERKLKPEQFASPSPQLLQQVARDWGARYFMTVVAYRLPEEKRVQYKAAVWEVGQRNPAWSEEGMQPFAQSGEFALHSTLQSVARTVALKLSASLWRDLPATQVPDSLIRPVDAGGNTSTEKPVDPRKEALERLQKNDYVGALSFARLAVNQSPMDIEWRVRLIDIYRKLNLNETALQECERCLSLFPGREEFVLKQVDLLIAENRAQEAQGLLQERVEKNPQSLPLLLALCDLELAGANYKAALTLCEQAYAVAPTSPEVGWRRYVVYGAQGTYEQAMNAFPPQQPTMLPERYRVFFIVASGALSDMSAELMNVRGLLENPNPPLSEAKPRSEKLLKQAIDCGRWLEKVKPEPPLKKPHDQLRFAGSLMNQSAQSLARYLLYRKKEDMETALLLRAESLRELEAARKELP